jgi:hypothetical protein
LDENEIYPELLIFIDDKLNHVEDLFQACSARNISFIGIRFSGADEYVDAFKHQIANSQRSFFTDSYIAIYNCLKKANKLNNLLDSNGSER